MKEVVIFELIIEGLVGVYLSDIRKLIVGTGNRTPSKRQRGRQKDWPSTSGVCERWQ